MVIESTKTGPNLSDLRGISQKFAESARVQFLGVGISKLAKSALLVIFNWFILSSFCCGINITNYKISHYILNLASYGFFWTKKWGSPVRSMYIGDGTIFRWGWG